MAIARGLEQHFPGCSLLYLGTDRGLEADIVPKAGLEFHTIRAVGLERRLSLGNLKVPREAWAGYRKSCRLLREFAPRAVVGTGGYVCGPVLLAAKRCRIPTLIHEQNAFPGITNRILSRVVDRVAVTFEDALPYFPRRSQARTVGLPVRPEILTARRSEARAELGLAEHELLVLSFGGSQGALTLNRAMALAIGSLARQSNLKLLHVTGPGQYEKFKEMTREQGFDPDAMGNITIKPYLYEMPTALAAADLVISRAGAATLAEITARGLPAVLVPFPYATGNHQEHNARALVKRGAAEMVLDRDFSGALLTEKIVRLTGDPERLQKMATASQGMGKPRALDDIIAMLKEII